MKKKMFLLSIYFCHIDLYTFCQYYIFSIQINIKFYFFSNFFLVVIDINNHKIKKIKIKNVFHREKRWKPISYMSFILENIRAFH
jgi:hypothetical protein